MQVFVVKVRGDRDPSERRGRCIYPMTDVTITASLENVYKQDVRLKLHRHEQREEIKKIRGRIWIHVVTSLRWLVVGGCIQR